MRQIEFRAMNCEMALLLDATPTMSASAVDALLQQVPQWFAAWEQMFSRFRSDSELSRLNDSAGQVFAASYDLIEVLEMALNSARSHQGLVSPLVLDALIDCGYTRSFELLNVNRTVAPANVLKPISASATSTQLLALLERIERIELNAARNTIFLPEGVRVDLGGFVKGWCADVVVAHLAQYGAVLMDAGGDIAISGPMRDGSPWPIAIAHPLNFEQDLVQISLAHGGVATSGRDHRHWQHQGQTQHHIIDPRTGSSARTDVLSATVTAPSTQLAEQASKMLMILGAQDGMAWLQTMSGYAACLVKDDGRVLMNEAFESLLETYHTQPNTHERPAVGGL